MSKQLFELRTRWRSWSIFSKRGTHFAVSFLFPKSSCKIVMNDLIYMPATSANSHTFTFGSSNTMSRIFSMISGVVRSFGIPRSFSIICPCTSPSLCHPTDLMNSHNIPFTDCTANYIGTTKRSLHGENLFKKDYPKVEKNENIETFGKSLK